MKRMSTQWLEKGSDPPKKAKVVGSEKKIMLIAFFDIKGMIYQTYLPKGQTVNSDYYQEVLSSFLRHLRTKRPEKIQNGWLLHQDNARPHVSNSTMEFMAKKGIKLFEHAPYSPDLAPCDFWLFPQLKTRMSGLRFDSEQALKTAVQGFLTELTSGGVVSVFEKWNKRLLKCIEVEGDYVEK
jgi:histone-lysine N-methyltransferase SETMAR